MENKIVKTTLPKARKQKFFHKKFGDTRSDPYYWLRNRDTPEVLNYLREESRYAKIQLQPLQVLKNQLFKEMKSRFPAKQDQEPVPVGDYFYYRTWEKEKPYPIHKRKKKSGHKEEILLDENFLKKTNDYMDVGELSVSPNHKILAYALDDQGREFYNIYFKNLNTGRRMKHFISSATSNFVWANDNQTVFYVRQDEKTLRAFQVYRFNITTGKDEFVFKEKDLKFSVHLNKTLDKNWITLLSFSSQSTEYRYLPAHQPKQNFSLFCKRKLNHEYHLDYGDDIFYVLSNKDQAFNFKLMKVNVKDGQKSASDKSSVREVYPSSSWKELIPHRPEVFIENYEVFSNFIALKIRSEGRLEIEIFNRQKQTLHRVDFSEKVCSVSLGDNKEYDNPLIRLEFQSLTQPAIVYDYDADQRKLHFKSQDLIKGGFDSKNYISQSEYALAEDGSTIPLSIFYRKDLKPNASTPLFLYAYGSYGMSMDPGFSSIGLSLSDRGFIYAIAHIRGGSEKGRKWYEGGKLLNKKNTFSDFICCAEYLIDQSYTSSFHLYIMGGSAGGLLMGSVVNQRPDLFRAVVASVPFIDCLTTMLDENIPLSTMEYEEWGNPNEKKYYNYIKSYSPYDNVKKTKYPHILIQTGYHDPRVQYWEPAKWTAKLRDNKIDNNLLLLLMNMKSGHFGSTGRLELLKLYSLYYAFLIGIEQGLIGKGNVVDRLKKQS